MLALSFIRENPDRVKWAMEVKRTGDPIVVDKLLGFDSQQRAALKELQSAQSRANAISKDVGTLMRQGKGEEAQALMTESSSLKENIKEYDERAKSLENEVNRLLLELPNIPHESVPVGNTAEQNQVVFVEGDEPGFNFEPLPHWDLASRHQLVDFERGAKVTGAGFPFYLGKGAKLQRALINYFLDLAVTEGGYEEIQPPILINEDSARGTGQIPDKEDQMYKVERDTLYLVPTAEVPVTNYFRGEILAEDQLPLKWCAYTPCFRREAGSYGKDVRGLNRLHQFDKVELVQFVRPESSYDTLESMCMDAERPLQKMNLRYRRLLMCTGDMGFTQSKKYDLEVWSAGQQKWLEVSSISNFEAFQARRAGIRFRTADSSKPVLVHTLNGSGLALPRIMSAILENGQQLDGSILIPEVLQSYTGFEKIG